MLSTPGVGTAARASEGRVEAGLGPALVDQVAGVGELSPSAARLADTAFGTRGEERVAGREACRSR